MNGREAERERAWRGRLIGEARFKGAGQGTGHRHLEGSRGGEETEERQRPTSSHRSKLNF